LEVFKINKDRGIKLRLIRYFLSRQWYPFMEVDIYSREGVSKSRKLITDIDVIALFPSITGKLEPILGDCKTLKNQSPIARALWMRGLMACISAKQGLIVLEKNIEKDHKSVANDLDVNLLSLSDFENFASKTSNQYNELNSALSIGENWDNYFNIPSKFPKLNSAIEYSKRNFWNQPGPNTRLRHTLAVLKEFKSELNPDHELHIALLLDIVSLFAIALNEVVCSTFNQYLVPVSKDELSDELKVILWDGIENYNYWNDLRKRLFNQEEPSVSDLSLPEWNSFIQLVRNCLDEPMATSLAPLILKEVAFEFLTEDTKRSSLTFSKKLVNENPQAARFAILTLEYICKVAKLPPEFYEIGSTRLINLQL